MQGKIRARRGEEITYFELESWRQMPPDKFGYTEIVEKEELPLLDATKPKKEKAETELEEKLSNTKNKK